MLGYTLLVPRAATWFSGTYLSFGNSSQHLQYRLAGLQLLRTRRYHRPRPQQRLDRPDEIPCVPMPTVPRSVEGPSECRPLILPRFQFQLRMEPQNLAD